jgi:membrane-bound lytic murein transglycosylase B
VLSVPAGAARLDVSPDARQQAAQLVAAANAVAATGTSLDHLRARPPATTPIDQVRADLQVAQAAYGFRNAIRQEQEIVYSVAGQPDQESATLALLPAGRAAELSSVDHALRTLWQMSGYDPGAQVRPRHNRSFAAPDAVETLLGYYRAAGSRAGIDWTYLAAINFIESDFGRTLGPSSAGAMGPMQFLPATFEEYGGGGDIMSAHDSIQAAATMLARNGAPGDYGRAVLRYNHSQAYVTAVEAYAAAIRSDTLWLTRLYYWSTYG